MVKKKIKVFRIEHSLTRDNFTTELERFRLLVEEIQQSQTVEQVDFDFSGVKIVDTFSVVFVTQAERMLKQNVVGLKTRYCGISKDFEALLKLTSVSEIITYTI